MPIKCRPIVILEDTARRRHVCMTLKLSTRLRVSSGEDKHLLDTETGAALEWLDRSSGNFDDYVAQIVLRRATRLSLSDWLIHGMVSASLRCSGTSSADILKTFVKSRAMLLPRIYRIASPFANFFDKVPLLVIRRAIHLEHSLKSVFLFLFLFLSLISLMSIECIRWQS